MDFVDIYKTFFQIFGLIAPLVIAISSFSMKYLQEQNDKFINELSHYANFSEELIVKIKSFMNKGILYKNKNNILGEHRQFTLSRKQKEPNSDGITEYGIKEYEKIGTEYIDLLVKIEDRRKYVKNKSNYILLTSIIIALYSLILYLITQFFFIDFYFQKFSVFVITLGSFIVFYEIYKFREYSSHRFFTVFD